MLDDHRYSLNRIVAYAHRDPQSPAEVYGPGGPERTYGVVVEIHEVGGTSPRWEYTIANSFTQEERRLTEDEIFHGADQPYLDLHRRDGIPWQRVPPESARDNADSRFWAHTLRQFVRAGIPRIVEREKLEEHERVHGRDLDLQPGDYVRVRGDLRPDKASVHNLYAKVLSASDADIRSVGVPPGTHGLAPGSHKIRHSYHVLLDDGQETDVYDIEVKTVYTKRGRLLVVNWRAASYLAEAFGDDPPYDLQFDYIAHHIFSRAELRGLSSGELAEVLARLLYVKGLLTRDELEHKADALAASTTEFLTDQILELSRFDVSSNRRLTDDEIERFHRDSLRLRDMLE